jgi:hypothetical protein
VLPNKNKQKKKQEVYTATKYNANWRNQMTRVMQKYEKEENRVTADRQDCSIVVIIFTYIINDIL